MSARWFIQASLLVVSLGIATTTRADDVCASCVDEAPPSVVPPPPPAYVFEPKPRSNLLLRYELGGVYTHAIERNFGGARVDIQAGGDFERFVIGGRFGLEAGGTESGLPYQRVSWGGTFAVKLGRVQLGVEPRFGFILINRRSDSSEPMAAATLGIHGDFIIALIGPEQPSKRTGPGLDLIIRPGYDWIDVDNGNAGASSSFTLKVGLGGRY